MDHLTIIRDIFPSQVFLTPKQVARVLYGPGKDTKKRVEGIRQQLDAGSLIPGLRKPAGQKRWHIKVVDLARALNREYAQGPELVYPPVLAGVRSRFKNPRPRLAR